MRDIMNTIRQIGLLRAWNNSVGATAKHCSHPARSSIWHQMQLNKTCIDDLLGCLKDEAMQRRLDKLVIKRRDAA